MDARKWLLECGGRLSLLAAVEEDRVYSCLDSRGGSDFSDREGSEC